MASLNKVFLIGNLGRDPDIKFTSGGTTVANLSLATSERQKDKEPVTEWHSLVMFGKLAEVAREYLKKGSTIHVTGKLQTRTWEDKDGGKHYKTEIVVYELIMLGPKREGGGQKSDGYEPPPDDGSEVPF